MHIKYLIVIITIFLIYDTYHDNKYINQLKNYTKYYKMFVISVFGMGLYVLLNNGTHHSNNMKLLENFINIIPIDKNSKDIIKPFITDKYSSSIKRMNSSGGGGGVKNQEQFIVSDKKYDTTKRSVSETKKKYIASLQDWKCGDCNTKLPAWFEVDHVKRLDRGGTNEINNLVALCRNCHGKKTAMENML